MNDIQQQDVDFLSNINFFITYILTHEILVYCPFLYNNIIDPIVLCHSKRKIKIKKILLNLL